MYAAGDRVLYGSHGVCCVTALEERRIDRKNVTYLALQPEGQSGASYLVPTHNAAAMAKLVPLLNQQELETLLSMELLHRGSFVEDGNLRKQTYRDLLAGGDRVRLLQMICALYRHREIRAAEGKKFHQSDEAFLRDAERLICSEISWVMGMDTPTALQYLRGKLNG